MGRVFLDRGAEEILLNIRNELMRRGRKEVTLSDAVRHLESLAHLVSKK